jgi:hypothetical protein
MENKADEPDDDDLLPEYDFKSMKKVGRGIYAARYREMRRLFQLEEDLAVVFPNDAAVNAALRDYLRLRAQAPSNTSV